MAWHILLPAFTVGLASYVAVIEGLYFFTGKEIWFQIWASEDNSQPAHVGLSGQSSQLAARFFGTAGTAQSCDPL